MKTFLTVLLLCICYSCKGQDKLSSLQTNMETMESQSEKIYVTALIYFKAGEEDRFIEYKNKVDKVFAKHNGYVTKRIKPLKLLRGDMTLPDEIHFGHFADMKSLLAAGNDREYQHLIETLRTPSLEQLVIILSKSANFNVGLETGDQSKFYGITLLNYKNDSTSESIFNEYLTKTCAIMSELGTNFEHFLVPFQVKGHFAKPDKVHLFYLDSMEGFQKIRTDPRMQEVAPLREKAVKKVNLILGKAL